MNDKALVEAVARAMLKVRNKQIRTKFDYDTQTDAYRKELHEVARTAIAVVDQFRTR